MDTSKAQQKLLQQKLKEGQKFLHSQPPDFSRATSIFIELTELAPNWSEGFFCLALALLQQSQFNEAEPAFRKAIALNPTDSRPHTWLGIGLGSVGRLNESMQCFRDGLALKPHYGEADSRMELASVLKKLGRIEEAVAEWQSVAKMQAMYPSYEEPIEEAKRELQSHGRAV